MRRLLTILFVLLIALAFHRPATAQPGKVICPGMPALTGDTVTTPGTCQTSTNSTGGVPFGALATQSIAAVANGGTGSANVSDALQQLSGVLNASSCRGILKPTWCAGSDVGAWVNSAIAYAAAQGWSQPKIVLDPTSTYNQTTQITKPLNDMLDCQGANLIWQSTAGVPLAAAGAGVSKVGGTWNCWFSAAAGWAAGHTNIAIYSGGDPAGVITPVDATDANDIFFNVHVSGFKYAFAHGNNSWSNNLMFPVFNGNYDGVYGAPGLFGTVTAFSITANVATITVANTFAVGDVINITGLTTGTYLNKVPLTVTSASSTQFTAAFAHANVSTTTDSGQAFDGFYNAGEPSVVIGGSISNNYNCAFDLNYSPDQWSVNNSTHMDYNAVAAVCGGAPNIELKGYYIEQSNGPALVHSSTIGNATFRLFGGQVTLTGTGTDTGYIQLKSASDRVDMFGVGLDSTHAVTDVIYSGGLSNLIICALDLDYQSGSYAPGSFTDASSFACPVSGGFAVQPSSGIPYRGETYATVGQHLDAPSLPAGAYFCNQIAYIARTDIAPNAQICVYHGTGGTDTDKLALGMLGANGVITIDVNSVITLNGSLKYQTRVISSGSADTVDSGAKPDHTIIWNSSVAGTKAQTIPACSAALAGRELRFKDRAESAGTYPITLTPVSGTIDTQPSASISHNGSALTLQCDGTSDWMVM